MHLLYLMSDYLASTFIVLTLLVVWPDVDEGDLMDEEFDSESDAKRSPSQSRTTLDLVTVLYPLPLPNKFIEPHLDAR